ncbi:MAG: class I SAM-dependent methyltransferase [Candidatus Hermodarchaeota archaeon]
MIGDKLTLVIAHCKNKEVLDIGCVEHFEYTPEKMRNTLHYRLKPYTKKLVGIDIVEQGVHALNLLGCDCRVAFAEEIQQDFGKFDVILLGDVIEHAPDPCTLLTNLRPLLKKNGTIICTTPNALSFTNLAFLLMGKRITRHQHVAWYCRVTLKNLFLYSGYKEINTYYTCYWKTTKKKWRIPLEKLIFRINEEYAPGLLGIFRPDPSFKIAKKKQLQKKRLHI